MKVPPACFSIGPQIGDKRVDLVAAQLVSDRMHYVILAHGQIEVPELCFEIVTVLASQPRRIALALGIGTVAGLAGPYIIGRITIGEEARPYRRQFAGLRLGRRGRLVGEVVGNRGLQRILHMGDFIHRYGGMR